MHSAAEINPDRTTARSVRYDASSWIAPTSSSLVFVSIPFCRAGAGCGSTRSSPDHLSYLPPDAAGRERETRTALAAREVGHVTAVAALRRHRHSHGRPADTGRDQTRAVTRRGAEICVLCRLRVAGLYSEEFRDI